MLFFYSNLILHIFTKITLSVRKIQLLFFSFTVFFCVSFQLFSQNPDNQLDSLSKQKNDSLSFKKISTIADSQEIKDKNFQMQKSPLGAILRSLVLPGWGQIYVENYWKAPLFAAGCGLLVYFVLDNNSKYQTYQNQYDELKKTTPNSSDLFFLGRKKEFYRDNRDQSAFFLVAVYLLAAIDSYVGAHLYDFNVDDNIALSFKNQIYPSVTLKIKIK
jgi:hypothetical protein